MDVRKLVKLRAGEANMRTGAGQGDESSTKGPRKRRKDGTAARKLRGAPRHSKEGPRNEVKKPSRIRFYE